MYHSPSKKQSARKNNDAIVNGSRDADQPLLVVMIIDKSGSMSDLTADTVGGFNEYLADRQRETPDALMCVTLFDTELDQVHVARRVSEIPKLTEERYREGGMGNTALNDAIGKTITAVEGGKFSEGRKVLVVVMTDGHENASTEWTSRTQIAKLVKRKEEAGWKFVFFGANIDAFAEGESMNIPRSRSVQYSACPQGTSDSFRRMSRASSMYAKGEPEKTWVAELSREGPDDN
jgi:Mg-chelatase subunit ChlD